MPLAGPHIDLNDQFAGPTATTPERTNSLRHFDDGNLHRSWCVRLRSLIPTGGPLLLAVNSLPSLPDQAERLIALGVANLANIDADELRAAAQVDVADALLVIHPDLAPASALAPLLRHGEKSGFIVTDMNDVDEFLPISEASIPNTAVYLVSGIDRGDEMSNWSPDETLPALTAASRTPLTLTEGIHWLLQVPTALERNQCFMTIGSRRKNSKGQFESRTPAIWISNGTGRDGKETRGAPKVGWCWAGNRHTWLGFASASHRLEPVSAHPPQSFDGARST